MPKSMCYECNILCDGPRVHATKTAFEESYRRATVHLARKEKLYESIG